MSIIIAKIFAIYMIVMGLALIFNPRRFVTFYDRMLADEGHLLIGGIIALLFGAFIVAVHNVWVAGWPVAITILGWWSVIKGAALVHFRGFSEFFRSMASKGDSFYRTIGVIATAVGAFFASVSWFA